MSHPIPSITELKQQLLPSLFASPARLGEYGSVTNSSEKINQLSNLMETGSTSALASKIASILTQLTEASPERVAKKPSWLARKLGGALETQARYQVARATLEQLLSDAQDLSESVRETIGAINLMIDSHAQEAQSLQLYIQAGREFLEENPQVGAVQDSQVEFDRPRERLARKLANLSTLLASHELSISQMKLSRAQAIDMLDRFEETVNVLVPVWRQHTLTLITTKNMSPELVEAATAAHKALIASLSESLVGTQH